MLEFTPAAFAEKGSGVWVSSLPAMKPVTGRVGTPLTTQGAWGP